MTSRKQPDRQAKKKRKIEMPENLDITKRKRKLEEPRNFDIVGNLKRSGSPQRYVCTRLFSNLIISNDNFLLRIKFSNSGFIFLSYVFPLV